jgi:hypothetical protein
MQQSLEYCWGLVVSKFRSFFLPKITLDDVVALVMQLSVEERLQLFDRMVKLTESDEQSRLSHPYDEPTATVNAQPGISNYEVARNEGTFLVSYSSNAVSVLLDNRYIFQVFFYPENLRESRLQIRRRLLPEPSEEMKTETRKELLRYGIEVSDEESLIRHYQLNEPGLDGYSIGEVDVEAYRVSREISALLPDMTWILCSATIDVATFAIRDLFGEIMSGCPDLGVEEMEKYAIRTKAGDVEKLFQPFLKRMKAHVGVTQGGARQRKARFVWDVEKAWEFYTAMQFMPLIGGQPLWEYARERLRDHQYDLATISWLKSCREFVDVPEDLLTEAASAWRRYEENWDSLPAKYTPQAFAFRHACHQLNYPEYAYNTLRAKYYQGRKKSRGREKSRH